MKLLVLYGSTRRQGNSELLAERVIADLPATRVYLADHRIQPIVDQRHEPGGFAPVADDYDHLLDQLLAHDILLFATPLYWYGMSGVMKNFVDRWSQALRDPRVAFKAEMARKEGYVVIAGDDDPRRKGLPLVQQFGHIFDFVGMRYGGYLIGQGNRPGEVLRDTRALAEAASLNEQLRQRLTVQEGESR